MGWASGSRLADKIWSTVAKHLPADSKHEAALAICKAFKAEDCDTLDEAEDLYLYAYPWAVIELAGPDDEMILDAFATQEEAEDCLASWKRHYAEHPEENCAFELRVEYLPTEYENPPSVDAVDSERGGRNE